MDSLLRAAEPVSLELGLFLTRYVAAARPDDTDVAVTPHPALLDTLLATAAPWPVHLVLTFLGRVASALDAGAAAGIAHASFTPRCVVLDGPELTVTCDDDPTAVDAAYIAPERRPPAVVVDATGNARASQYGLAVLASTLLAADPRRARTVDAHLAAHPAAGPSDRLPYALRPGLDASVERVLLIARDPTPSRRYATAGAFVAALDAACGALAVAPDVMSPDPRAGVPWRTREPAGGHVARRVAGVSVLVVGAALAGAAAGWSAADRPTTGSARDDVRPVAAPPVAARVATIDDGTAMAVVSNRTNVANVAATPVRALDVGVPAPIDDVGAVERRRDLARRMSTVTARVQSLAHAVVIPRLGAPDDMPRSAASPRDFAPGNRRLFVDAPSDRGPAVLSGTVAPRYPTVLLTARTTGEVVARFVVDTTGAIDPATIEIVRSSHPAFATAVQDVLPTMRFLPAEYAGRHVRRAVEQTFAFKPPY